MAPNLSIAWLQALIDLPAEEFDSGLEFWSRVTGTTPAEPHPEHDEFIHLIPPSGDAQLELQRLDAGPPSAHLDLAVTDIPAWTEWAIECGAEVVARPGHSVLRTPGGVPFCIVPAGPESARPGPIDDEFPHAVDQICLDVPHEHFEADVAFWSTLTGWEINPPSFPEFRSFKQPAHLPLRVLIQQLGPDDDGPARAHLDISSGDHLDTVVARHRAAGASEASAHRHWTALVDPAGLPYCITTRTPDLPEIS